MSEMKLRCLLLCAAILLSGCATSNYKISKEIGQVDYGDKRSFATIHTSGTAQIRTINGKRITVGGYFDCDAVKQKETDYGYVTATPGRYTLTVVSYRITKLVADGRDLLEADWYFRSLACTPGFERIKYASETTEREFRVTFDLEGGEDKSGKAPTYWVHLSSSLYGFAAVTRNDDPTIIGSSNTRVVGRSIKEFARWP